MVESASSLDRGPRVWSTFHRCIHCPYIHRPFTTIEPREEEWFVYTCPIVGEENTFGGGDEAARMWAVVEELSVEAAEAHPRARRIAQH
jgi:hypothetical protein